MNHAKKNEIFSVLSIIMLSISPAIFLGDGNRNLALIFFMFLSPLFLVRSKFSTDIFLLLGFATCIVLSPAIVSGLDSRWSTVFYSLLFCVFFLVYQSRLQSGFLSITAFLTCIRYLLIAYTLVLFIQQLCVLLNLPIFNISNYDLAEPWKLNSLSAEPSHSARIVGLLMVTYILGLRLSKSNGNPLSVTRKQTQILWICFFWSMLTMMSTTSVIMLLVVGLIYIRKFNILSIFLLILFILILLPVIPEKLLVRAFGFFSAFLTFDFNNVLEADHSGGLRIAPMMILTNYVEIFSVNGMLGNGIDSVASVMSRYLWGVEENFSGGGLLALWYEYGFIPFILFSLFTLKATGATKSLAPLIFWFLIVFLSGVNSQIVWLTICLLYTLKFFQTVAKKGLHKKAN